MNAKGKEDRGTRMAGKRVATCRTDTKPLCANDNLRTYSLLDSNLKLLASAKAQDAQYAVNMLLFAKKEMLHILAATDRYGVDLLVFNGRDTLHFVQTFKVSSSYVFGAVWLKNGEEALICGSPGILKSIKLT